MPPVINPQNRVLLKFMSCEDYVNDFLSGHLYMNCLDYFWNEYKPENSVPGQMDLFEGVYCTCDVDTFGFEKKFAGSLISDISMRAEGYKYCNVHNYYRLDYQPDRSGGIGWKSSSTRMRDFGDYVVIIADETGFLRRVHAAASGEGFEYLCGNVHYRQPKRQGEVVDLGSHKAVKDEECLVDLTKEPYRNAVNGKRDSFDKMSAMSYQKEWRISLYRGVRESKAYMLDLGCRLDDIVYVAKAEDLNQELEKLFRSRTIKLGGKYIWYGNIDKHALRDKFYALGDNKASLLGVIG